MARSCSLAAAAAFVNGLYGDWLDDDPVAITQNPDVPCENLGSLFVNLSSVLSNDFWGTPLAAPQSHLSFRPVTTFSFRLQHCLMGFHSVGFHIANVLLHAIVTALFHGVLSQLTALRKSQRSFAALLFALHAVHVECVTNVVGRAELLSAVAAFSALLIYAPLVIQPPAPVLETLVRSFFAQALAALAMLGP